MRVFRFLLDLIFPPRDIARVVDSLSEESFLGLLHPSEQSGIISLLPYRHPWVSAAIIEAKFNRNARAHHLLGAVLRDYLATYREEHETLEDKQVVLVPLPLGEGRLRERGYNQVEAVLRAASLSYQQLLVRTRETAPQTQLSAKMRIENMRGAFSVRGQPHPDTRYIVIDDVTTTGATLRGAESALHAAGATHVDLLALAH